DAEGQRTRKVLFSGGTLPTGTTLYHYDLGGKLIAETKDDGTPIRDYLWHDDEPLAQIDTAQGFETLRYLHTNHLQTPRLATGTSGAILWRWEGEAFGSTAPELASATINLRFPGQYFDAETGLHYNYFRDYDPSTGRYVQSDPVGLDGGINTYSYVDGNPLSETDPLGLVLCAANPGKDCRYCDKLRKAARVVCLVWCLIEGKRPPPDPPPVPPRPPAPYSDPKRPPPPPAPPKPPPD
ncbi:MAG: RHS repeat-associated core domain-containing protein, partial [Gammaproteobacteria bacterium]